LATTCGVHGGGFSPTAVYVGVTAYLYFASSFMGGFVLSGHPLPDLVAVLAVLLGLCLLRFALICGVGGRWTLPVGWGCLGVFSIALGFGFLWLLGLVGVDGRFGGLLF